MPLSPGTKLGPYEILAPIGAGALDFFQSFRELALFHQCIEHECVGKGKLWVHAEHGAALRDGSIRTVASNTKSCHDPWQ
jgi:hypothetical protein